MPHDPLLVPQAGMFSGRRFGDVSFILTQPSVFDSFAGQLHDIISVLFKFPACSSPMPWAPILLLQPSRVGLGCCSVLMRYSNVNRSDSELTVCLQLSVPFCTASRNNTAAQYAISRQLNCTWREDKSSTV
jgi:hypothetical protein